jgi:outer membrane protein assembly factor BamB
MPHSATRILTTWVPCAAALAACHLQHSPAGDLGTFPLGDERDNTQSTEVADAGPHAQRDAATEPDGAPRDASTDPTPEDEPVAAPDAATGAQPSADRWTMAGYDLGSTYNNAAEHKLSKDNIAQLVVKQVFEVRQAVYGAPLIVDGTLYYNAGREVSAVDVEQGALRWITRFADSVMTNSMAYDDGTLYLQQQDGHVIALNTLDGSVVWEREYAGETYSRGYAAPIVAGDSLLLARAGIASTRNRLGASRFRGSLIALDKRDGSERWRAYTVFEGESGVGIRSHPAVDMDLGTAYVSTDDSGPSR